MPRRKVTETKVSKKTQIPEPGLLQRLQTDLSRNQNYLNLILGSLILVVIGVLLFNYFNRSTEDLGPSQTTDQSQFSQPQEDVAKDKLPGKYTVKEGDTLFDVAQNYYGDGYQYPKLVAANKLENENLISIGQTLEIPKIEGLNQTTQESPNSSPTNTSDAQASPTASSQPQEIATGGAENATIWGDKITADTYTVQAGDWLSKIAARSYGDIMQYDKIAQANNISNPDTIEVGTVLKIPK